MNASNLDLCHRTPEPNLLLPGQVPGSCSPYYLVFPLILETRQAVDIDV